MHQFGTFESQHMGSAKLLELQRVIVYELNTPAMFSYHIK